VAGVSAGAAFACAAFAGRTRDVLEDFKRRTAANDRNIYPRNSLGSEPVFPHEGIYRGAILSAIDEDAMKQLRKGPEIRILLARPPEWLGRRMGFVAGGLAYALDRRELRVHARWGRRFGFQPEIVPISTCQEPDELADLILHSSCSPPLVPLYRRDRRIVLDGGLVDNAPAALVGSSRRTLVLLSRRYGPGRTPDVPGRVYVQPSEPLSIVKWDYTSPDEIQRTYDQGCKDGETFVSHHADRPGLFDTRLTTGDTALAL
jgi:predicted acylesterase/phospholipase RssA